MKFKNRLSLAFKTVVSKDLNNSLGYNSFGTVTRNYQKKQEFDPVVQLRNITYRIVDVIGTAVSVYTPVVSRADGEPYNKHPLYALFNKPNGVDSANDLMHLYGMLYEIYGETFWYLARGENTKKIKEFYLLDPSKMKVVIEGGEVVGYVMYKSDGNQIPFTLEEIIHDKRPNPFNQYRGISVLERASDYINLENITSDFTLNYMQNNASPSGIVTLPEMTPEAFKQFTKQWRENYEGPGNAGKTAFIRNSQADFKVVGATLKDIDQKVTREMAKDDVFMVFGVPKEILGFTKDSGLGRSTIESFEYLFQKEKIEPMLRRLDRVFQRMATDSFARDGSVTVSHNNVIPQDKEFQLKSQKEAVNRWMTVNEVRALDGLDPLPNGDELPETPQPAPTTSKKVTLKKLPTKAEVEKKLNQEQEEFRKELVETNEIYVVKLKRALSKFMADQQKEIISKINATSKAYEEWLFDVKEDSEKLALLLTPIILELMEAQAEGTANFITGEAVQITPELNKKVTTSTLTLSGKVNQDTIVQLQKSLTEGQANGESLSKLKKRVEGVYSDAKGYRAERIARSEGLRASNEAAELTYNQSGYSAVEWFVNPGACEFCQTFEGRTKEIGSSFNKIGDVVNGNDGGQLRIEYGDIDTPPLHPNCTCSLVPVN